MTWEQYALARQLLVEEAVGTRVRAFQRQEDEEFNAGAAKLRQQRMIG